MRKQVVILLLLFTSLFLIQATTFPEIQQTQVFLNEVEVPVGIEAVDEQKLLQEAMQQYQEQMIKADRLVGPTPVEPEHLPEQQISQTEEQQQPQGWEQQQPSVEEQQQPQEGQWGGKHHKKCHGRGRFNNMTEEQRMEFWKNKREHHKGHKKWGHHGKHHKHEEFGQSQGEMQNQFLSQDYMTNFQQENEAPVPPEQGDHHHRFKHWKKFHKRKCRKILAVVIGVILLCCLCCILRKIIKKCKKCHQERRNRCCRRCRCDRQSPQGQQQSNNSFNAVQTQESFDQPQVISQQPQQIYPQLNFQQQQLPQFQPRYIPSQVYQQQQQPVYQYPVFVNNQLQNLPVGVPAQFDRKQQM